MTRQEVFYELKAIIANVKPSLDLNKVTMQSSLLEDLGVDSLSILLLSLAIENRFGFTFDGVPQFSKVGEVVDYVCEHCDSDAPVAEVSAI